MMNVPTTDLMPQTHEDVQPLHASQAWAMAALRTRQLPAALLCLHADATHAYAWAMQWVRGLRCQIAPEQFGGCGTCVDCRWIQANQHPEVMTLSPHTPIEEEATPDEKTATLKVAHMHYALRQLMKTTAQWRVVIVCDSRVEPTLPEQGSLAYPPLRLSEPSLEASVSEASASETWVPLPLTKQSFPPQLADRLLKTLEQPPEKTLFIFIAQDTSHLLPTIVSRCVPLWVPPPVDVTWMLPQGVPPVWQEALVPVWQSMTPSLHHAPWRERLHQVYQAYQDAFTEATPMLADAPEKASKTKSSKKASKKSSSASQERYLASWLKLLSDSVRCYQAILNDRYNSQAMQGLEAFHQRVMQAQRMLQRYVAPELVRFYLWTPF
ncbi:MAG: hypothetical protein ACKO37_06010 [Vampirovibrionales bacterium]